MPPTEGTYLLGFDNALVEIDSSEAEEALADNWKWILAAGVVSVLGGIVALASPTMASGVLLIVLSSFLLAMGGINITGLCFAEHGLKGPSFALGIAQVLLGVVLLKYPLESLMVMTILLAVIFMMDGFYKCGLAHKNREMPGWSPVMMNGICSILFSALVLAAFPSSALYTIGILVGVNFVTGGMARIYMGWLGRNLATRIESDGDVREALV